MNHHSENTKTSRLSRSPRSAKACLSAVKSMHSSVGSLSPAMARATQAGPSLNTPVATWSTATAMTVADRATVARSPQR